MEKNNTKKIILLMVLSFVLGMVVITGTYAYFAVSFKDDRTENNKGETIVKTEELPDAVVISNIDKSAGKFSATDIYQGHKEVASLSVSANGTLGTSASYQFKYDVNTNELGDAVKVSLYVSDIPIETNENYFNCKKTYETVSNETRYFEECEEKTLGTLLEETILSGGQETKIIGKDSIVVTKENDNTTKYYYAVVEFLNQENSQNEVMSKKLEGNVLVEVVPPVDKTFEESVVAYGNLGNNIAESMLYSSYLDKTNLIFDETVDNNLRYVGANPNNYVDFNGEKWRIIGVMNNVEDSVGNKDSRIKLIRDESIGSYSWDTSPSNINDGYGINEWSVSDAKVLLNDYYYNSKENQKCYSGRSNATKACDFKSIGLSINSKTYIDSSLYYIGSNSKNNYSYITIKKFYELERSSNNGKICSSVITCNDKINRTTTWSGYIGLIYPSDYGYATSGGINMTREKCLNEYFTSWNNECQNNNWLHKEKYWWSMNPIARSNYATSAFVIGNKSSLTYGAASDAFPFYPTLYLNTSVKIIFGNGSNNNPYILSL